MTLKEKQDEFISGVKQNERLILSVCAMYTRCSKAELSDLYQDAVCALWNSYDSFRGDCSLSSWIYAVTKYTMLSIIRKRQYQTESIDTHNELTADEDKDHILNELRDALELLNPGEKDIFIMKMEGFTNEEIASAKELSYNAVALRIHRITKKLRKVLNQ